MGFTELTRAPTTASVKVPPNGAVLGSRAAGPKTKPTRYLAIKLGPAVCRALGFHMAEQALSVRAGHGEDAGKLAISCDAKGKFRGKKQAGGEYLITVQGGALAGHLEMPTTHVVIENARVVPAQGNSAPMCILKVAG